MPLLALALLMPAPSVAAVCQGVRPGALIRVGDQACTMNFLFRDKHGQRYIGTAGHCVLDAESIQIWRGARGPAATDGAGSKIGTVAYAAYSASYEKKLDFALVRLSPKVSSAPSMCGWGGPRGINTQNPDGLIELRWYGQGDVLGQISPQRSGYAYGMPEDDFVFFNGPAVTGDSGSAVIDAEGHGVGVFVTVGVHTYSTDPSHLATNGHVGSGGLLRLMPQLKRAEKELRSTLRLIPG